MMKRSDIKVGQTMYIKHIDRDKRISESKVIKVGYKYIYVGQEYGKFRISDGMQVNNCECTYDYKLYLGEQEILEEEKND